MDKVQKEQNINQYNLRFVYACEVWLITETFERKLLTLRKQNIEINKWRGNKYRGRN